jgi:hypothetical protein
MANTTIRNDELRSLPIGTELLFSSSVEPARSIQMRLAQRWTMFDPPGQVIVILEAVYLPGVTVSIAFNPDRSLGSDELTLSVSDDPAPEYDDRLP